MISLKVLQKISKKFARKSKDVGVFADKEILRPTSIIYRIRFNTIDNDDHVVVETRVRGVRPKHLYNHYLIKQ